MVANGHWPSWSTRPVFSNITVHDMTGLHNRHDVCYEGSCSVIWEDTGPILLYGFHRSAELLWCSTYENIYTIQCSTYENTTQPKYQSMYNVHRPQYQYCWPNQRSRKTILKNIFNNYWLDPNWPNQKSRKTILKIFFIIINWIQSARAMSI